jgi:hypothetical protein
MTDQASLQLTLSQDDSGLNVGAFVKVLKETTNSYKFLFLLALLNRISRSTQLDEPIKVPLTEMALDMLTLAWYPCRYFKLSFGQQDQIPLLLHTVGDNVSTRKHGKEVLQHIRQEIKKNIDLNEVSKTVLRYVPFRLLRPFFNAALKGNADSAVERLTPELSRQAENSSSPALYALHGQGNRPSDLLLHLHPKWRLLILKWHYVIHSWVLHEWAKYLQIKNPAMPNVLAKLLPPDDRNQALSKKIKRFWGDLLCRRSITCLYSHVKLDNLHFELDHFLPWSYIGHDLPWNLVPVEPSVNSSKGAKLPDEKYIEALAARQYLALDYAHTHLTDAKWKLLTESYCQELRLSNEELLNLNSVIEAYYKTMLPQLNLGKQLGFEGRWVFTNP